MPDTAPHRSTANALTRRLNQLFALRPTLKTLGVTQSQWDQRPEAVLEYYAEKLIDFFCEPQSNASSCWASLARWLAQSLRTAIDTLTDPVTRDLIKDVLDFPDGGERAQMLGSQAPLVRRVWHGECLALAISRNNGREVIYTLARGVELLTLPHQTQQEDAERLDHDVFEGWALSVLETALQRIERVDLNDFPEIGQLDRQLAWASRFGDFLPQNAEQDRLRHELAQQLPNWLEDASPSGRLAYSKLLSKMAKVHRKYRGTSAFDDSGQLTSQSHLASLFAVQWRRLVLEYCLQGLAGVTEAGYRTARAAVRTYSSQRQGIVFRPLMDEPGEGYLIGASSGTLGPWLIFRPWSTGILQQVNCAPASGPALTDPFLAIAQACVQRACALPVVCAHGSGWAWLEAKLPMVEHPLQTLARLKLRPETEDSFQPAWRIEVSLLRNLASLLLYPGTLQAGEPEGTQRRVKRLASEWAGARQTLSTVQRQNLEKLRRPASSAVGTLIREGAHAGLRALDNALIYNSDENHYNLLSNNRIDHLFNINNNVFQVVDDPEKPIVRGPDLVRAGGQWQLQRAPRLRRDVEGLSVSATKAMKRGASLSAALGSELDEADQLARQSWASRPLPVAVEERLERKAVEFDDAGANIVRYSQVRKTAESEALIAKLREQAAQLRAHGRYLRIEMTRHTEAPTLGDVQYLLAQNVVVIYRLNDRMAQTADDRVDYLQEYAVLDLTEHGRPLWYAHFHYPSLTTGDDQPSKAHLKTAAQRKLGREYEQAERAAARNTRVYRGPITNAAGRSVFLSAPRRPAS